MKILSTGVFVSLISALLQVNAYQDDPTKPGADADDSNQDASIPFDASLTTGGMDCTYNGESYEEGVGIYDTEIPCRMYVCEYGIMKPFYFMCYMDGKCYDEGQTWTSGCEQFTCRLTSRGYLPQSLGKLCLMDGKCYKEGESWTNDCKDYTCTQTDNGFTPTVTDHQCKFERKGKVKCLQDGAIVRDGPCVKRQCQVSKTNAAVNTKMMLLQDFGGCGYAKGCRKLHEIWTYRCVTKQCVTDGWNFVKISLQPRCIRRGQCYSHGQSYTTNTCVTRTCEVNVLVQKAWFEETKRQCRYDGKCIDEGQTVVKKCAKLTCTKVTKKGRVRYIMKRIGNVCKQQKAGVY